MGLVVINSVASKPGGGLVILKEFIRNIPCTSNDEYIIFTGNLELCQYSTESIKIVFIDIKGRIRSYKWLLHGMRRWCRDRLIFPTVIVSLQNTGVNFDKKIPQLIYYHQAIPLVDHKWNLFKRRERSLWFYKRIYPWIIKQFIGEHTYFAVQQNYLVTLIEKVYMVKAEKIKVFRPYIKIDNNNIKVLHLIGKYKVFYPCSEFIYKNHLQIAKGLNYLKKTEVDISGIKVYLTVTSSQVPELYSYLRINNLVDNFIFVGTISHQHVISYYASIDLLIYPSYIECFTLPLFEIIQFNKPVLVADVEYSREQLKNYNGAYFAELFNDKSWGEAIIALTKQKDKNYTWEPFPEESWGGLFNYINKLQDIEEGLNV